MTAPLSLRDKQVAYLRGLYGPGLSYPDMWSKYLVPNSGNSINDRLREKYGGTGSLTDIYYSVLSGSGSRSDKQYASSSGGVDTGGGGSPPATTFKSAGVTFNPGATTTLAFTIPAGVVASDTVLLFYAWGNGTPSTVTPSGPGGAVFGTIVASRNDNNMGWGIVSVSNVVAGNVVTLTFGVSLTKVGQAFVFSAPVGTAGAITNRAGVSQAFTNVSALSSQAIGKPILLIGIERSVATGITVSSAVLSSGEAVTQLAFSEESVDPATSFYIGRFISTTTPTGTAVLTYSGVSGNGAALLLGEIA